MANFGGHSVYPTGVVDVSVKGDIYREVAHLHSHLYSSKVEKRRESGRPEGYMH